MKVMKFGGGSLRDAEGFLKVARLIEKERPNKTAVVVSAVYGVTDKLEAAIETSLQSEDMILELTNEIRQIHYSILENVIHNLAIKTRAEHLLESKIKKMVEYLSI